MNKNFEVVAQTLSTKAEGSRDVITSIDGIIDSIDCSDLSGTIDSLNLHTQVILFEIFFMLLYFTLYTIFFLILRASH